MVNIKTKREAMIAAITSLIGLACCIFTMGCLISGVGTVLLVICIIWAMIQIISYTVMSWYYLNTYFKKKEEEDIIRKLKELKAWIESLDRSTDKQSEDAADEEIK